MAHPNVDVFPVGNAAGYTPGGMVGTNKLWLSLWGGEILKAYDQTNIFEALITTKNLTGGVSWEFPITGTVDLEPEWGRGTFLSGDTGNNGETVVVLIDQRPMAAKFETDNVDRMIAQWDFVSELGRQAGLRLANTRDKQIAVYLARAAAESQLAITGRTFSFDGVSDTLPIFTDTTDDGASGSRGFFGEVAAVTTDRTNAALQVLQDIEDWVTFLEENDLPTDNLHCAVTPRGFRDIRTLGVARVAADVINSQPFFGGVAQAGGLGAGFKDGMSKPESTLEYMDVIIHKTNHMPIIDYTGASIGNPAKYDATGDFSGHGGSATADTGYVHGIKALLWHPEAVAGLSLMGMKTDTLDDIRRNTQFSVASMHKGTGVLKPELAAVICSATNEATSVAVVRDVAATAASLFEGLTLTEEYLTTASGVGPYQTS